MPWDPRGCAHPEHVCEEPRAALSWHQQCWQSHRLRSRERGDMNTEQVESAPQAGWQEQKRPSLSGSLPLQEKVSVFITRQRERGKKSLSSFRKVTRCGLFLSAGPHLTFEAPGTGVPIEPQGPNVQIFKSYEPKNKPLHQVCLFSCLDRCIFVMNSRPCLD